MGEGGGLLSVGGAPPMGGRLTTAAVALGGSSEATADVPLLVADLSTEFDDGTERVTSHAESGRSLR